MIKNINSEIFPFNDWSPEKKICSQMNEDPCLGIFFEDFEPYPSFFYPLRLLDWYWVNSKIQVKSDATSKSHWPNYLMIKSQITVEDSISMLRNRYKSDIHENYVYSWKNYQSSQKFHSWLQVHSQICYRLFFLRSNAQFFTQICMKCFVSWKIEQTGYMLVNLWTTAEYHVKLWLMWKKFATIS